MTTLLENVNQAQNKAKNTIDKKSFVV